jgi:hypothetical protein
MKATCTNKIELPSNSKESTSYDQPLLCTSFDPKFCVTLGTVGCTLSLVDAKLQGSLNYVQEGDIVGYHPQGAVLVLMRFRVEPFINNNYCVVSGFKESLADA